MTKIEFENYLKNICPWVNNDTFNKFQIYKQTIQYYNKITNLSRLVSDELIYDQYFLSSLIPFTKLDYFIQDNNYKILDIGTGSGIPGIVLKIVYPNIKLTLIESSTKKCNFLEILLNKLNFNDVTIINNRCELCYKNHIEKFDIVTSRAVSSLNKILELSIAFSKISGHIIALKSQNYLNEMNDAKNVINFFNIQLINKIEYQFSNHNYVILDFVKLKKTQNGFPRSWNKIMNNPI